MRFLRTTLCLAALLISLGVTSQAQRVNVPSWVLGPALKSPEVHPDKRVTFRISAPNAKEVMVNSPAFGSKKLTKNDKGVWEYTSDPLEPDYYTYNLVLDGTSIIDPANTETKSSLLSSGESVVHVPGSLSLSWELNAVPHGTIHHHFYRSGIIGDERDYYVYTPPGYQANRAAKYPVLYLLHGLTDDASAWATHGREGIILDNLIAQGKAQPMIIVNTLGYGMPDPGHNLGMLFDPPVRDATLDKFVGSVLNEVIPAVEQGYRARTDRNSRAVAGLSMGGAQSLLIGLNHLDKFAWIGSFSGAFIMLGQESKVFPKVSEKSNEQIRSLWIACGTEDFLIGSNRVTKNWLKSKGVKVTSIETPGAHTWMVWRRNLTEFAALLFQPKTP